MKIKKSTKIELKKLTIAKILTDKMQQVNGGDCLPTEHYYDQNTVSVTKYTGGYR